MVLGGGLALGVRSDLPLAAEAHLDVILLPFHRGLLVLLDGPLCPGCWLIQSLPATASPEDLLHAVLFSLSCLSSEIQFILEASIRRRPSLQSLS